MEKEMKYEFTFGQAVNIWNAIIYEEELTKNHVRPTPITILLGYLGVPLAYLRTLKTMGYESNRAESIQFLRALADGLEKE